jgi:hypothetical protein
VAGKGRKDKADQDDDDNWDSSSSIWTMRLPQGEGSGAARQQTSLNSSTTKDLPLLTEDQLTSLVTLSAWAGHSTDPALASSRGEQHVPVAGVWPEYGLVNHSCAPNAVQLLVGGRMVIRSVCNGRSGTATSYAL